MKSIKYRRSTVKLQYRIGGVGDSKPCFHHEKSLPLVERPQSPEKAANSHKKDPKNHCSQYGKCRVRSGFSSTSRPCQSLDSRHNNLSPLRTQSPRNAFSNSSPEGEPG